MRHVFIAVAIEDTLLITLDLKFAIADFDAVAIGKLRIGHEEFGRLGHAAVMPRKLKVKSPRLRSKRMFSGVPATFTA